MWDQHCIIYRQSIQTVRFVVQKSFCCTVRRYPHIRVRRVILVSGRIFNVSDTRVMALCVHHVNAL